MEYTSDALPTLFNSSIMKDFENKTINFHGTIHKIRNMGNFAFVIVRTHREVLQCVYSPENATFDINDLSEGDVIELEGTVLKDERSSVGFEVSLINIKKLSGTSEEFPIVISGKGLNTSLDVNLTYRPLTLRNPKERAVFKIQDGISRGFREFLTNNDFTEIHTPKIVFAGAEGGSNIFKLPYFGKEVFLTQSPQFYKQAMMAIFERVYEVGPVFRAEKHDTSRHLNEYTSLDFEMGFIDSFYDIINMETALLKYIFNLLETQYSGELEILKVTLPVIDKIPMMKFADAKDIIVNKYKKKITDFNDFEPEEEKLLCKYAKEELGCDFLFVTHYPSAKRPFYAMDDSENPEYTLSFDLLYNGLEITTGGQRIHSYEEQVAKMVARGMDVDDFDSYLMLHKYGAPPHGGLGLGLERLTMQLLNFPNVRNSCLFPRDITRVTP